jgi:hypothetical protein
MRVKPWDDSVHGVSTSVLFGRQLGSVLEVLPHTSPRGRPVLRVALSDGRTIQATADNLAVPVGAAASSPSPPPGQPQGAGFSATSRLARSELSQQQHRTE